MKRDDGGSAFPYGGTSQVGSAFDSGEVRYEYECLDSGMSLRDYFAAAALTGFCQHQGWIGYMENPEHRQHLLSNYARDSYAFADAMLEARKESV